MPPWATADCEPVGQLGHEVTRLGDLERLPHLLLGRVGQAVLQVAGDGAAEEERLLRDQAELRPEQVRLELADVDTVDQHAARGHVEEARHEVEQRGLAGAGGADDRHRLAGAGAEVDVVAAPAHRRRGRRR